MQFFKKTKTLLGSVCAVALLSGCAATGTDPQDPYESWNRKVYSFNDAVDKAVLKPVTKGYVSVTPRPVQEGVSRFFDNVGLIDTTVNAALQGKPAQTRDSFLRFMVNSVFGIAGIFDVAQHIGLPKTQPEDFGQTLATWGVDQSSYLMLPFLGPSSTRDVWRWPVQYVASPSTYYENWAPTIVQSSFYVVDARARLLEQEEQILGATIDPYVALREAYLSYRLQQVHDGQVPRERTLNSLTPLNLLEEE